MRVTIAQISQLGALAQTKSRDVTLYSLLFFISFNFRFPASRALADAKNLFSVFSPFSSNLNEILNRVSIRALTWSAIVNFALTNLTLGLFTNLVFSRHINPHFSLRYGLDVPIKSVKICV